MDKICLERILIYQNQRKNEKFAKFVLLLYDNLIRENAADKAKFKS